MSQVEMRTSPMDNGSGVERAMAQLDRFGRAGGRIWYDSKEDTLFLRATDARQAVSYFLPYQPEVVFRLDPKTGDLTGLDLTDYRRVLVKEHPEFGEVLSGLRIARVAALFRRLPGAAFLRRSLEMGASQDVAADLGNLCRA